MRKLILLIICLMTALGTVCSYAQQTFEDSNFTGQVESDGIIITGVKSPVKDLVIPASLVVGGMNRNIKEIATGAFMEMSQLETLTIDVVLDLTIETEALKNCTNLRKITAKKAELPDPESYYSRLTIKSGAIAGCPALEEIDLTGCNSTLYPLSFYYCGNLRNIMLGNVELGTDSYCASYGSYDSSVAIFGGISDVDNYQIKSVSVAGYQHGTIPYYADAISNDITNNLFGSIKHIGTLKLPNIDYYREGAFAGMTIDNLFTNYRRTVYIDAGAFRNATINNIRVPFSTPPVFRESDGSELDLTKITVTVPKGCAGNFSRSPYWGQAAAIIEDETINLTHPVEDALPTQVNGNLQYAFNADGVTMCQGFEYYDISGDKVDNLGTPGLYDRPEGSDPINYNSDEEYVAALSLKMPDEPVEFMGHSYDVTAVAPYAGANAPLAWHIVYGGGHFYECAMLEVSLNDRCESIGKHAFEGTVFKPASVYTPTVYFGQSLREIGEYVFRHATFNGLDNLEFPAALESIGAHAFEGVTGIGSIKIHAVTPPETDGSTFFTDAATRSQMTLYVPQEAVEAYRSVPVWQDFDIQTILAVSDIAADSADAPATYYNMQGIRVEAPGHGLYIRRDADGTARVVRL